MILQQLYHDAPRILGEQMPPPMYDNKPVRWIARITASGEWESAQHLMDTADKESKKGIPRLIPYVGRTSGLRPILLADTRAYVFGIAPEDRRAEEKHQAFKDLVHQCKEETGDPLVAAVDAFLQHWQRDASQLPDALLDPKANSDIIVFEVDGKDPVESDCVRQFWARIAKPQEEAEDAAVMQCLVTGQFGPVEKSLPGMLKGIPGGQTSGTALVSANAAAFESYGLERAQTSPISREAAERFTKALNRLLAGTHSRVIVGNVAYVFWTRSGPDEETAGLLKGDEERVAKLLRSPYTGDKANLSAAETEKFYALGLSASVSRAVVRDWLTTTVGEKNQRMVRWFKAQWMVGNDGQLLKPLGVYALAASLYRDARKEMVNGVVTALVRSALHGDPMPSSIRDQAVLRCRAEQNVTSVRAALLKMCWLLRPDNQNLENFEEESKRMRQLDAANENAAYQCGRLLAELERIQRRALGRVNTTLVDRFYGAASSTPAAVFGQMLGDANKAHLPKIRKQNEGAFNAMQNSLANILQNMEHFPPTLTLQEQSMFALGYYHQRAENLKNVREYRESQEQNNDASEKEE